MNYGETKTIASSGVLQGDPMGLVTYVWSCDRGLSVSEISSRRRSASLRVYGRGLCRAFAGPGQHG